MLEWSDSPNESWLQIRARDERVFLSRPQQIDCCCHHCPHFYSQMYWFHSNLHRSLYIDQWKFVCFWYITSNLRLYPIPVSVDFAVNMKRKKSKPRVWKQNRPLLRLLCWTVAQSWCWHSHNFFLNIWINFLHSSFVKTPPLTPLPSPPPLLLKAQQIRNISFIHKIHYKLKIRSRLF